jgi:hypothetical protein
MHLIERIRKPTDVVMSLVLLDRFNVLGCQSPSATPAPSTTMAMPTATPSIAPQITPPGGDCLYWSAWVNSHKPSGGNEIETVAAMSTGSFILHFSLFSIIFQQPTFFLPYCSRSLNDHHTFIIVKRLHLFDIYDLSHCYCIFMLCYATGVPAAVTM